MRDRSERQSHFEADIDLFESFCHHPMISTDPSLGRCRHPQPSSGHDEKSFIKPELLCSIEAEKTEIGHQKIHAPDE